MAFHPDDISNLLAHYDIQGTVGARLCPARCNLLIIPSVRRLQEDDLTIEFDQYSAEGYGVEILSQDVLNISPDSFLQKQTIRWETMNALPTLGHKCWLREVREVDLHTNYIYDGKSFWQPLQDGLPLNRPIHHLELYAGGLGGWKAATTFLQDFFGDTAFSTIAIEHDERLAAAYAISHEAQYVSHPDLLTTGFLHQTDNCIVIADACDVKWQLPVADWQVDVCTISAPCPPWSGASNAPGLNDPKGLLLLHSLLDCRYLRPFMILIEQVPGFAVHDHRPWILIVSFT